MVSTDLKIKVIVTMFLRPWCLNKSITFRNPYKTLKLNTDYTIKYSNNINAGTGTVRIEGKGKYYRNQNSRF